MPKAKQDVVIQEPPMEEFGKKHSCIKRTCLSGCGCVILLIIGFVALINFATTHRGVRNLKSIPRQVTATVPLYDAQNVKSIKLETENGSKIVLAVTSFLPKLVLSPLIVVSPEKLMENPAVGQGAYKENLKTFFKKPLRQPQNTYILEWKNLPAELSFIEDYYESELKKRDFTVEESSRSTSTVQMIFKKDGVEGVFLGQDMRPEKDGTDTVVVTINMETPSPAQP